MIGYIYLTTNDVNQMCYVGKRQKPSFEKSYKGSGTRLKQAFSEYGRDKFHTSVLEWCDTKEELCKAEKKWIAFYKEKGIELYNVGEGGEGGNMVDWESLPAQKRQEINEKNRQAHIGSKNGFFGKHHTAETKRLLREKNKKNKYPKELAEYKRHQREKLPKIKQINKDTGEVIAIWNNWCEAGRALVKTHRCGYTHISECCNGTKKTAYGYKWEVVRDL